MYVQTTLQPCMIANVYILYIGIHTYTYTYMNTYSGHCQVHMYGHIMNDCVLWVERFMIIIVGLNEQNNVWFD